MSRIEWSRLAGEDVEAVVAMMVNRERPNSTRITPSRGDGGVDILDRGVEADSRDTVYQIKRYAAPLSAAQRRAVERSLESLARDPRWADLDLGDWILVTPWDPTPEAETWLLALGAKLQIPIKWRGLTYVEQLAAKYPDVVDYYLNSGKALVQEAYQSLHALFNLNSPADDLDIPSFAARVQVAMGAVNADPHYRYEIRVGEGELPDPVSRPSLVLTWMQGSVNGGPWVAVDVIARCAVSCDERPISISGVIRAETDSAFEGELRDFLDYGAPLDSPYGAYSGEVDAPAGLGGPIVNARVKTLPLSPTDEKPSNMRLEVLDPSGAVLHQIELKQTEYTKGQKGLRVVREEASGVFAVEDRLDVETMSGSKQIRFRSLQGMPVMSVLPALRFLDACRPPNTVRVSRAHASPARGQLDEGWLLPWGDQVLGEFQSEVRALELLARLQEQTDDVLKVPGADVELARIREWRDAVRLLDGEELTVTYPEDQSLRVVVDSGVVLVDGTFAVNVPLTVLVGDIEITLEGIQAWFEDERVLNRYESSGKAIFEVVTPDRAVRYRRFDGEGD